mmetsp:Transcript_104906/g.197686  ORF Transcript_104906/g.197686 Transcript_104906/m.197686 type:complete len:195 (+) Transcript_104906:48-632(+)
MEDCRHAETQELRVYNTAGAMTLALKRIDAASLTVQGLKTLVCNSMSSESPSTISDDFHTSQLLLLMGERSLEDTEELDLLWPSEGCIEMQAVVRSAKAVMEMFLEERLGARWQERYFLEVKASGDVKMPHAAGRHFSVPKASVPDVVNVLGSANIEMTQDGRFHCTLCRKRLHDLHSLKNHLSSTEHRFGDDA